jgi:hypothetical protein
LLKLNLLHHEAAEHQRRHQQEQDHAVEEIDCDARGGLRRLHAHHGDGERQHGQAVLHERDQGRLEYLANEEMRDHPDEQQREQVERSEHRDRALPAVRYAGHRAADQAEQDGQPYRQQPPVVPCGEYEADHHDEDRVAGGYLALTPPHRLPRQEQTEMRQEESPRPYVIDAPGDGRMQGEKHEAEPQLGLVRQPAGGRGCRRGSRLDA